MKTAKLFLFIFFCSLYGGAVQAATLKDRPEPIFYPAGHYLEGWPRSVGNDMYGYPTYEGSGAWVTNHRSGIDSLEHHGKTK